MSGWPYENGQPLRCSRCGCAPAIRIVDDRQPGPWCVACLPVSPTLPRWAVGKCRKCSSKGARIVSKAGRTSGPWCAVHRPLGQPFGEQSDRMLEQLANDARWHRARWSA
jgi:hypothetical protein